MQYKRLEYIDSLRGFAILLIILCHVGLWCTNIHQSETNYYHHFFNLIQIPLFFFISGFVLYKSTANWSLRYSLSFLGKKIPFLLISPLIFLFCLSYVNNDNFITLLTRWDKGGYWFTFTLFEYYFIYALSLSFLFYLKIKENKISDFLLLLIGVMLMILTIPRESNIIGFESIALNNIIGIERSRFFLYFVIGTRVRKYLGHIEFLLDKTIFLGICIAIYFLFNIFQPAITKILPQTIFNFTIISSAIFILFALFKKNESSISQQTLIGRLLQNIGRKTLDIYFIHYFFIRTNINKLIPNFQDLNSPVIELCYALMISGIIIFLSLGVSTILRLSPEISYVLFGQKYKKRQNNEN